MKVQSKIKWIVLLSFFLMAAASWGARNAGAAGFVGTQTCIDCHSTWLDNNPTVADIVGGKAGFDYPPLNLLNHRDGSPPFYSIPEGWSQSIHNIPASNLTETDANPCEGCHGSGLAHFGVGPIPTPIPNIKTCGGCHNLSLSADFPFDLNSFLMTAHANPSNSPKKYFDQPFFGTAQAKTTNQSQVPSDEVGLPLFKAGTSGPLGDPVTRNDRIEECSVCHQYAFQYPQFSVKIAENALPEKPQVTCGACHDAHIVAPDGPEPATVTNTVVVTAVSGTTLESVAPIAGRSVSYLNHKPYKLNEAGAQDVINGIWTRGSVINRPQTPLIKGTCAVVSSGGTCSQITFTCQSCAGVGFLNNQVQVGDTILLSGVGSITVTLPSGAIDAGKSLTVQATLDAAGFEILQIIDNNSILINPPVVASTTVNYTKTDGSKGSLSVSVPFCGLNLSFEVRDMLTNTWDLCGACHTRGTYKYTKWGQQRDKTLVDLSPTHNTDVRGQYNESAHADRSATPFFGFQSFSYGSGHQSIYPFDMSINGSGGVGTLRNNGNTSFQLVNDPDPSNIYLIANGNTTQPTTNGLFVCYQCHNGLGTINYLEDRQGTANADVIWGDATVVCITCHNPHKNQTESGKNIRVPVKLSYNTFFVDPVKNPRGGINKFMDGTDIPGESVSKNGTTIISSSTGVMNGIICLFCHQGRESGLTVFLNIKTNTTIDPYTNPDARLAGINSFQNPHYLESGAILWAKNAWEFIFGGTPQVYSSGILEHQTQNCMGCHMGEASPNGLEGGHTWSPRIETCQQCHPGVQGFTDIQASDDWDGSGTVESAFLEIGGVLDPVAGTGNFGLMGQLRQALAAKGIFYNPNGSGTYFFTSEAFTTSFTNWTTNTLTAAFNLSFLYKAGACRSLHDPFYSAQILIDSLKALGVTLNSDTGKPFVRPAGNRNATDYRTIVVNP